MSFLIQNIHVLVIVHCTLHTRVGCWHKFHNSIQACNSISIRYWISVTI